MAKLKGPLFSLGATGQLGKTLVFFGWKGLDVVREYVVPSNPNTTAQQTQRGYLTDAVAFVHTAQGAATNPLDADDIRAYALLAGVVQSATTWFNQVVRAYIDQKVASKEYAILRNGSLTPGVDKLTFRFMEASVSGAAVNDGDIYWGTSKTALINVLACTCAQILAGKDITGLTTGVKYYAQYRINAPAAYIGTRTGIFYGVPT